MMAKRVPLKPRRGAAVGRASIKKSTIKKVAKEGKRLRGSNTGDAFQNFSLNLGLGTSNALSQSQYGFYPVTRIRTLLEWIHRGSWIGGVAIDLLADDMTRGGVEILTIEDTSDVEKIQQLLTRLHIWSSLSDNIKWAQLYGGSIAVVLIDGQDPSTPLRVETVAHNAFRGLIVLDRWMVEADLNHLVTEYGPHLGYPMFYKVLADAPAMRGARIHYSRCIRLEGIRLPYYQRIMENLWGLSIYERIYDRMIAFDSATVGASQLVYKSFLRTYKINGLQEAATAAGDALVGISQRVELMRKYQGIEGITLLDSEDDFTTHEVGGYSGIADMMLHFAEQLSGALQIPLVRLLGQSPAGLSSTGESDLRTYYDNILQRQERDLREGTNLVLRLAAQSLRIKLPDNFNFNFVPLWQLDEEQKAAVADQVTRFVLETEASGLVSQKVALQELRQVSKVTGKWTNIDNKMIDEAPDVAAPPMPEMGEGGEEAGGEAAPGGAPSSEHESGPEQGQQQAQQQRNAQIEGLERMKQINRAVGVGGKDRSIDQLPFSEIAGVQVVIEYYPGTIRRGDGWAVTQPCAYGYIRRTPSAEGEEEWLDCLVGNRTSSRDAWVIDSVDLEGNFDEHKVCLGFANQRDAVGAFKKMYDGHRKVGAITHFSCDELRWKNWLKNGDKTEAVQPRLKLAS
jgi:phage-related protein (TIGR01555 family)